jgi:hypothetical protein
VASAFFNNGCSRSFISTNLHRSEEARPEEVSTGVSQFPLIFAMQLLEIGFASDTPKRFRSKSLVFNLCNRFSAIDWPIMLLQYPISIGHKSILMFEEPTTDF